jgi:outer membrane receptor protein involved in Fe transport
VQVRRDWLSPVGLYHTSNARGSRRRAKIASGRRCSGLFAQTEIEWTATARTTLGLRADTYHYDVHGRRRRSNRRPTARGPQLVSPKCGVVFGPWAGTEWYVNAGTGFHSNDAAARDHVDPASGEPAIA